MYNINSELHHNQEDIVSPLVICIYTPMDIYRCLILDSDSKLRSFYASRTKRLVNALSYYVIPRSGSWPVAVAFVGDGAKIQRKCERTATAGLIFAIEL